MTGDPTEKRPPGERPRRSGKREPAVLDLKAESSAVAQEVQAAAESQAPASLEPASADVPPVALSEAAAPDHPATSTTASSESSPADLAAMPADGIAAESALATAARNDDAQASASREAAAEIPAEPIPAAPPEEPVRSPIPAIAPPPRQQSLFGPALAGLAGGFVGAAILTLGMFYFGPAGDVGERIAGLESAVGERASRRTVETLEKRTATLDTGTAALRGDLDALSGKVQSIPAGDIPALLGRVDRLERNVADLAAPPAAPAGEAKAAAQPAPLPPPQPPPLVAARESAVLAIALLLRDQLGRGVPYQRELDALKAAGADAAAVEALGRFAGSGAPRPPVLAAEFAPIAARIANPPPPPAHTVSERVSASFSGLFKVRPIGEAEGDSPAALAARAEALLQKGALADAVAALERIPPADAEPAVAFRDTLKARIAADAAAGSILSKAVDELLAAARLQGGQTR